MIRDLMLVTAAFLVLPPTMFPQQGIDLTGFWVDNTGGKYEIRQIGNQIYWLNDARPRYVNVYHGAISANTIRGTWADLPGGRTKHNGTLDLRIESNDRLTKIASSAYFGGTVLARTQATSSIQGSSEQAPSIFQDSSQQDSSQQARSIVGSWQTSSGGAPMRIRSDGTFTGAGSDGRWRELNSQDGTYELTWSNGSVNRVRLSADGQQLEDSSPFGGRVIATRMARGQRRYRDSR